MQKVLLPVIPILLVLFTGCFKLGGTPEYAKWLKVGYGMSVEQVQAILGPGTPVKQDKVKLTGYSDFTQIPHRSGMKPVVEGDHILQWGNGETDVLIFVAFKKGRYCEKYYYDPYDR